MTSRTPKNRNQLPIPDISTKLKDLFEVLDFPDELTDLIIFTVSSAEGVREETSTSKEKKVKGWEKSIPNKPNIDGLEVPIKDLKGEIYLLNDFDPKYYLLIVRINEKPEKKLRKRIDSITRIIRQSLEDIQIYDRKHLFQNLVENLGDMIFELDENGLFTYANPATIELTGYSEEELYKMHYLQIVDSEGLEDTIDFFKRKMKKKEEYIYHQCDIRKKEDGKKISVGLKLQFVYEGNWVKKVYAVARDITELLEARKELQESEEKYRLLANNSNDLIILHDLDGTYKYISPSIRDILGFDPDELLGQNPYDLVHPDDLILIFDEPERKKLLKSGTKNDEYRIRRKDGKYIWFESYTKPVRNDKNELVAFQSFSRNVTKQKENEEKLRKADLRLSQYKEGLKLLNEITSNSDLSVEEQIEEALGVCTEFLGMKTGILSRINGSEFIISYIYSVEGSKFRKNQVLSLTDTFSEEVFKKEDLLAIHNISNTIYKANSARQLFGIESYIGIPYYVSGNKAGTLVFISPDPRIEEFDQNDLEFVKLLSKWVSDVIQQQDYERNLMSDKMILQAFASSAPAAIAMFDEEIRYITASDKWYSDYGLENEYIIGRSYFEVFPKIGRDWEEIFQRALSGKVEHNDQDLIERENGEIQWIKWEVRPWYKKLDTVGGLIMYTEDITQQKEQQLQLKIAKRKAEQASKAKEQFLSTMSHEIRTPLNAIIGMTDLMLMDDQPPEQLKHLRLLKFSGENLLVLINDILDFNKIEAGKLEFEIVDFSLKSLLEKIHETLLGLAHRKNLEFKLNWDPDIPEYVKGDAVRINQVITNLINNAIKFTEEGYITLKARAIHQGSKACVVKFEVKDTGIGIPEEKIDTIFQSFEQASTTTTRKYGGSGLGLAIVKRILEYLNSSIKVHSTVGHGSTFYFELELPVGKSIDEIAEEEKSITRMRQDIKILIAEDNEANRILVESLFRKWKIDHDFAFNGAEAVEKSVTKEYDLILMDLQMPEMDGYEATKIIRKREDEYFKNLPIIALTASVMSNVLEKTKEVGMNSYVSKPFNPNNLKEVIAKYTEKESKEEATFTEIVNVEEEVQETQMENGSHASVIDEFPYLRSLIGDDADALTEIVKTTLISVQKATEGVKEGMAQNDIKRVRQELHVLRPNLHNLELSKLTDNLPQITELTEESVKLLKELISGIERELSSERLNIFIE